jgi:hypothetical protein
MKTGMKVLIEQLGSIEAERFVSLLLREPPFATSLERETI